MARKRFGQHFLEAVWADKLLQCIAPLPGDVFLEIGPGAGALTLRLAPRVAQLIAVEIDRDLIAGLTPKLPQNVSMVAADILEVDLERVLASIGETTPVRIAGNLPYNVSSPILFRLLQLQRRRRLADATVMLQREVADRIVARPGTSEYGVLSVLMQWHADATRVLTLPPGAFRPPPAVNSAVVRLAFRPPVFAVVDDRALEGMVRSMFMHRRKTLSNALSPFAASVGAAAPAVLRAAEIDPKRRPETLEIVEIARLADAFSAAKT